jgi:predicted O-methyltransferase YrrM
MTQHSEMAQIVAKLEVVLAQQQEILEQQRQLYRQTEALFALYSQLTLNAALPTLRGYAISPDFAKILMMQLQAQQPRLIVELGGGVSTLISGYMLQKQGFGRVVAVDQSAEFAEYAMQNVRQHQLEKVAQVLHAPLKPLTLNGQTWQWYDTQVFDEIDAIDLLVVDGPPQYDNPKSMARYPALPLLFAKLAPGAYILMDDAKRDDEQRIITRWLEEFDITLSRDFAYETEKGAVLLRKRS